MFSDFFAVYAFPLLLTLHLLGAIMFVGTVFFEVLILERIRSTSSERFMHAVESAVMRHAPKVVPWALLMIYGSGIGMLYVRYWSVLAAMDSHFAVLLLVKIVLAVFAFLHFAAAMYKRFAGKPDSVFFRRLHHSLFIHVLLIVLIAKWMFYL